MALIFNGNLPKISGNIKVEVPTPTYSGTASSDPSDSINPYTSQGPGAGGTGQTASEIAADRAGVIPKTPTTWNPADTSGGYTFSNNDLTVAHIGGQFGGGRSEHGISSGKIYWEITTDSVATSIAIGIMDSTTLVGTTSTRLGSLVSTVAWFFDGGFWKKDILITGITNYGAGDVLSVALDMDNNAVWLAKNGVWLFGATDAEIAAGNTINSAASGLVGIQHPAYFDAASSGTWQQTANFGGSAFAHTVPAGFTAGPSAP